MSVGINLLQEKLSLYNNLASYKTHVGRLSSWLEIFPFPLIKWDFEVLGDEVKQKGPLRVDFPMSPIKGYQFEIPKPLPTMDSHNLILPKEVLAGNAAQAIIGDLGFKGHYFNFYLPNTRFQAVNIMGQNDIEKHHIVGKKELGVEAGGKQLQSQLDDVWYVTLTSDKEALTWLDEQKSNFGTRITSIGVLHSAMDSKTKFIDYPNLTLAEAQLYTDTLSILLSFLNGGYVGPLYIEGNYYSSPTETITEPSAIALVPWITPLELLGISWCTYDSDLPTYLRCFQTLRHMLSQFPWNETFGLVLSWYFQAIQPEFMGGGKMWQVVANALGTALERLSYTILVLEEENPSLREKAGLLFNTNQNKINKAWGKGVKASVKRLQLILERIGISLDRGYWDVNEVEKFIYLRNQATHPKKELIEQKDIAYILEQATQWVYEIILWRLGYNGKYLIMPAPGRQSTSHRYDLSSRNPSW